ncbi:hypothetical protein ACS0TY_024021 [Phlomoides rotata]
MTWRVGNGLNIRAFEDIWIEVERPTRPPSLVDREDDLYMVHQFIDVQTVSWKATEVQQNFTPEDAEKIMAIPLSARLPEDKRIWKCTRMENSV